MPDENTVNIRAQKKIERHDVILNSLDREVDKKWFSVAPFEKTVKAWQGIPLIYAKDHPNMRNLILDPENELKRIEGKLVGWHDNPRIDRAGHPKLRADFMFDETSQYKGVNADPLAVMESLELLHKGELSHSTGFFCPYDEERKLYGEVIPNHTLLFRENPATNDMPKDPGAFILNKTGDGMDDEQLNAGKVISNVNAGEFNSLLQKLSLLFRKMSGQETAPGAEEQKNKTKTPEITGDEMDTKEFTAALEIANKATSDAKTDLQTSGKEIEDLKADLTKKDELILKYETAEIERKKTALDSAWDKAKALLPPGLTHKTEDEEKIRKLWTEDKDSFYLKVIENKNKKETESEGAEHTQKEIDKELKEANDLWDSF